MQSSLLKIFLLSLLSLGVSSGHTVEQLFLSLEKAGRHLELEVTFDAAYSLEELRNDPTSPQPPREWLLGCTEEEHRQIRNGAEAYLRESIRLQLGEHNLTYQVSFPDYAHSPPDFPTLLNGGAYLRAYITSELPAAQLGEVTISIRSGERPDFIIAIKEDEQTNYLVVEPEQSATLYNITSSGEVKNLTPSIMAVLWLGYRHVIPKGLDHILFILGLFLMARKWQPLVSQSLIFTLAHSISLGLAASGVFHVQQWPGAWLIEPLIAFSIAVIAVENIFYQKAGSRRLIVVFILGLIHGLGFAGSLGALLQKDGSWLITLAAANIGVELAQISLLAVAWCLTIKWWNSKSYNRFRIGASIIIATIGLWWTIERIIT